MPAFFVHGVADTHALWDGVRAHLSRADVMAPDLPGFGCPVPDGFGCSKEDYADWLISEVEAVAKDAGEPVHLVGHDWGALLVQRLVMLRPDLVRTWAAGGAALDPLYEWHDFARTWQQPETGPEMVPTADPVMAGAILALYRSAVDVFTEWGAAFDRAPSPGLVIWGADDPFVGREVGERTAARLGCDLLMLEGCGHWWPLERSADVAAALEALWLLP
ncbi:MAG: alpha/beta fold hydrolase [Actinobacteria bacterium]|nr:alpha/beta fold hydrolase [Actinomycetota bacterium]